MLEVDLHQNRLGLDPLDDLVSKGLRLDRLARLVVDVKGEELDSSFGHLACGVFVADVVSLVDHGDRVSLEVVEQLLSRNEHIVGDLLVVGVAHFGGRHHLAEIVHWLLDLMCSAFLLVF